MFIDTIRLIGKVWYWRMRLLKSDIHLAYLDWRIKRVMKESSK